MMNKEDFKEGQLVVASTPDGLRRETFYTVLEVHDSHMVLMHPAYGLDAVFYDNPRTRYSPATREELDEAQLAIFQEIREAQTVLDRKVAKAKEFQKAIDKLDETNL